MKRERYFETMKGLLEYTSEELKARNSADDLETWRIYYHELLAVSFALAESVETDGESFTRLLDNLQVYFDNEFGRDIDHNDILKLLTGCTLGIAYTTLGDNEEFDTQAYINARTLEVWQELWNGSEVVARETIYKADSLQDLATWLNGVTFDDLINHIDVDTLKEDNNNA